MKFKEPTEITFRVVMLWLLKNEMLFFGNARKRILFLDPIEHNGVAVQASAKTILLDHTNSKCITLVNP